MKAFARSCAQCRLCVKECKFLSTYGTPGEIVTAFLSDPGTGNISFNCSLCGLCRTACPKGLDPAEAFLTMRRSVFESEGRSHRAHKKILTYEKTGLSQRFSLYKIPKGSSVVFFPGCALAGTRAKRVRQVYAWLKDRIPDMGVVLDCCAKPSHDLGRMEFFTSNFTHLEETLTAHGVRTVITACPNCESVFSKYARKLKVRSLYTFLGEAGWIPEKQIPGKVVVHDPCVTRSDAVIHESVRHLVRKTGLEIQEMAHSREKTLCCGEGGTVFPLAPDLAARWAALRKEEAGGCRIITYCAGCSEFLGKSLETAHLLDLVFDPENAMKGRVKTTSSPFTYLSRLGLKSSLGQSGRGDVRSKPSLPGNQRTRFSLMQWMLLLAVGAGIIGARAAGIDQIISQESVQQFVQAYGPMAPMVFMLIVCLAPALFLPGAPFIIAGGLIFGPVWGVVYGITGATAGACLAFLVARYLASDWVESKITNPSLLRLKRQTEVHGWKIVALTRLIPLFPFNLLSYALGLTRIPFLTYLVTSFICMLPGCVGYILLSSSFLELLQGRFSIKFFLGTGLILVLALMPVLLKRFKPENF